MKTKGQYVYNVSMIVKRLKGSYSLATVDWSLINTTNLVYLNPIGGTLTFQYGQSEGHIDIRIVANDVSEKKNTETIFTCTWLKYVLTRIVIET